MDFHGLTRKELQSLCKLNKIPANITNVAMADALQSLDTVVGIEDLLNVSQSETADAVESVETVEDSSPKAPQTRCRTTTRQKAKPTETENLQTTVTRTTRRGSKQPPREVEESKNDVLKTPAVPRTTRKAPATSTRRNVNNQLNECENEPQEEGLVENRYSTRRSTRLTEKKSAAPRVKMGVEKAVKIDSCLDQGNSNAEVEDICNAFEKLDVVVIEEEATPKSVEGDEDSGEFSNVKQESGENSVLCEDVKPESDGISSPSEEATHKSGEDDEVNSLDQDLEDDLKNSEVKYDEAYDLKPDSDDISSPCEDESSAQMSAMKEQNLDMVQEEHSDADDTLNPCEVEKFEIKENHFVVAQEESLDCLLESGVDAELGQENTHCADSEMIIDNTENPIDEITTMEMEEVSENTVDAIPTMDEEVEDLKPEFSTENNVNDKSDADSGPTQTPLILSDVMCHPTHVTPYKKATPFKDMTEDVEDHKADFFTENNINVKSDAASGLAQNLLFSSDVTGHPTQATPLKNVSSVVSDDKKNTVDEGKKKETDENEKKNFNEFSIRQLKKQLKALTLKSLNSKDESAAAARPALQPLCENQMVIGGETQK